MFLLYSQVHRQHQWKSLRSFEKELCPVKHNSLNFLLSSFQDQTNGPKKKEGTQTKQTKDVNPSSIEKYHRHTIGLVVGCVLRQTNSDELQQNQSIGFK
jgi:hypothetical protein